MCRSALNRDDPRVVLFVERRSLSAYCQRMTLGRLRPLLLVLALVASVTTGSVLLATAASAAQTCTHTSSGSCIRGGELCPRASYGRTGTDARDRRYVCTGDRTHPHWEAAGATAKRRYHGPVLSDGSGDIASARHKPRTTYLTGDGTLTMYNSHWSRWTRTRAVGHGIGHYNTCDPYCYNGKTIKVKMTLVETQPRNRCGKRVFTKYSVTFARKPTKSASRHLVLTRSSIECN